MRLLVILLTFAPLLGGCAGFGSLASTAGSSASVNPASSSAVVTLGSSSARNGEAFLVRSARSSAFPEAELRVYQQDGDVVGPGAGRRLTWATLTFPPGTDIPRGMTTNTQAIAEVTQIAEAFCDGFDGLYENWSPAFRMSRAVGGSRNHDRKIDRLTIRSSQTGERMYTTYFSCVIQGASA